MVKVIYNRKEDKQHNREIKERLHAHNYNIGRAKQFSKALILLGYFDNAFVSQLWAGNKKTK